MSIPIIAKNRKFILNSIRRLSTTLTNACSIAHTIYNVFQWYMIKSIHDQLCWELFFVGVIGDGLFNVNIANAPVKWYIQIWNERCAWLSLVAYQCDGGRNFSINRTKTWKTVHIRAKKIASFLFQYKSIDFCANSKFRRTFYSCFLHFFLILT